MTERFREWEVAAAGADPIHFRLAGVDFHAVGEAPFGQLADFMEGVRDGRVRLEVSRDFIRSVLVPDDADAFEVVTHDLDRPVPREMIQEIVDWLIECYTVRPTERPSGSPDGPPSTEASSTEPVSEPV